MARKEIFIFIYFLTYTFIPIEKKTHKFFYKLCLLPIVILIWEPVIFFILFFFFLDLIENNILIDQQSADMLKGSEIDYVEELIGESFKINNPQTKSSCGCGVSFSL